MPNQAAADQTWRALADPTRRAVLERLSRGSRSTSELAQDFRMALPSFTQHLAVLEECGLVRSRKSGRVRTYEITPEPLAAVEDWLARRRRLWSRRLDRHDAHVIAMQKESEA